MSAVRRLAVTVKLESINWRLQAAILRLHVY